MRPDTVAARTIRAPAPEDLPPGLRGRPSAEPLWQTAVFDFPSIAESVAPLEGRGGYSYARYGLPNARTLELTVAALEGAGDALATSSGMAAVAATLLACAGSGDAVAVQRDAYGGTLGLLATDFSRLGIRVETVDAYEPRAVGEVLARGVRALLVESLSNPLVREVPLRALARRCRRAGVVLAVDNTFATPVLRRPLEAGADVVLHSATKFLGGHHDLCAGVVAGSAEFVAKARGIVKRFGMTAAPFDAWLCSRGIRTLPVRMERAQANARKLAAFLRRHPRVRVLHYPGWGALLAFDVGTRAAAERVVRRSHLIDLAPSLGGVTTTFSHSATASHRGLAPAVRRALGIGDGLLRVSVGLEDAADLREDLARALSAGR